MRGGTVCLPTPPSWPEVIGNSLKKQFWLHLSCPLPAQSYLGHMETPLAADNFSKPVFKSTGKLCPQAPSSPALIYYSSSGWWLALLDLGKQRVIKAKLLVRLASSAVCHCESGILIKNLITPSTYWVPAAHGAGTWHTLSLILRASLCGRIYYPHSTGEETEAVRGKFAHCVARLQTLCSFSTLQHDLAVDRHAHSPSALGWHYDDVRSWWDLAFFFFNLILIVFAFYNDYAGGLSHEGQKLLISLLCLWVLSWVSFDWEGDGSQETNICEDTGQPQLTSCVLLCHVLCWVLYRYCLSYSAPVHFIRSL